MADVRRAQSPCHGRPDELAALASALELGRRQAALACTVGPAGIGKTVLVLAAVESAASDLIVLRGGCFDIPGIGLQSPYGPFMEAIRRIPPAAGDAVLARAQSWLRPAAGASTLPVDPAEEHRVEFLGLLGDLAQVGPVVLILEDLHWADLSSLELLVFLARNLTTERVLVLAT